MSSGELILDDEPERVRRLELLATNIRKKYGRDVLRSCGLDDVRGRGSSSSRSRRAKNSTRARRCRRFLADTLGGTTVSDENKSGAAAFDARLDRVTTRRRARRIPNSRTRRWELVGALAWLRLVAPGLEDVGWGIALTGSVLLRSASLNDLDVICYPLSTARKPKKKDMRKALRAAGLKRIYSAARVREEWRRKGSRDEKHVEIWMLGRKRVDVFVLR